MARKKVKLLWVAARSKFEKKKLTLVKKVRDLTILCDVKACLIFFRPNESEPMVWPSVETCRELIEGYYALPEYKRKKNETTLESYMKEKIARIQGRLRNIQKKNMEHTIDQLMVQLSGGARSSEDLNLNEMYLLISFSKDMIMNLRKRLDFMHHPPLPDPFEPRTTTNDVYMIQGGQRINIGSAIQENQTHYLMDQWFFPSFEPSNPHPQIDQQIGMHMGSYDKESHHPYHGSSGNPNSEMEPIVPPMVTFHGLFGSVSQEPSPPPPSSVVIRQEPPPPKEAIPEGGNTGVSAMSFDLNKDWTGSLDF